MSDRISIKILPEHEKLIKAYQKSRGLEDFSDAVDGAMKILSSRIKALANYAEKTADSKPKKAKAAKKGAKAKKSALSKPSALAKKAKKAKAAPKKAAKAKTKGKTETKKSALGKPNAFAKRAATNSAAEATA